MTCQVKSAGIPRSGGGVSTVCVRCDEVPTLRLVIAARDLADHGLRDVQRCLAGLPRRAPKHGASRWRPGALPRSAARRPLRPSRRRQPRSRSVSSRSMPLSSGPQTWPTATTASVPELVIPTFEIITTVASSEAGPDGDYSLESTLDHVRPWVDAAGAAGFYVGPRPAARAHRLPHPGAALRGAAGPALRRPGPRPGVAAGARRAAPARHRTGVGGGGQPCRRRGSPS